MFQINTRNVPSLNSYGDALRHFENTKGWRGHGPNDPKPLGDRAHRSKTMRMGNNEQIHCTLYRTDVVTFYKDGTIEVDNSYKSRSTDQFMSRILARKPGVIWGNIANPVVWESWQGYELVGGHLVDGDVMCFDGDFKLTNPKSFTIPKLNVKKFNEVKRAYRLSDFLTWRKAYEAMGGESSRHSWRTRWTSQDVLTCLTKGGEQWSKLAGECNNDYISQCLLNEHPHVVERTPCDRFENSRAYKSWLALDAKYCRFI